MVYSLKRGKKGYICIIARPPLSPLSVSIINPLVFGIYNSAVKIHFILRVGILFLLQIKKKKICSRRKARKDVRGEKEKSNQTKNFNAQPLRSVNKGHLL